MYFLYYRPASLAFRSLIDFSNYSGKDVLELVPFTVGLVGAETASASSSSDSDSTSSFSGTKYTMDTRGSEDQASAVTESNVTAISDDGGDTFQEDIQYEQVSTSTVHTYVVDVTMSVSIRVLLIITYLCCRF